MLKLTQAALERKIVRGEMEVDYGPTRTGHYQVTLIGSGKTRTIRVVQ